MSNNRGIPPQGFTVEKQATGDWALFEGAGFRRSFLTQQDGIEFAWKLHDEAAQPARSELQYNLQKARALATELRCTLELIDGDPGFSSEDNEGELGMNIENFAEQASDIETWLDNMDPRVVGQDFVRVEVAPYVR